mgnify:CR=1 FL=1
MRPLQSSVMVSPSRSREQQNSQQNAKKKDAENVKGSCVLLVTYLKASRNAVRVLPSLDQSRDTAKLYHVVSVR